MHCRAAVIFRTTILSADFAQISQKLPSWTGDSSVLATSRLEFGGLIIVLNSRLKIQARTSMPGRSTLVPLTTTVNTGQFSVGVKFSTSV